MNNDMVLDVCCGSRMFWFNKQDERAIYIDNRREILPLDGRSPIIVKPTIQASFTHLPFLSNTFSMVIFDPPHIRCREARGFLTKKYGYLTSNWRKTIRDGFSECFRVLKPHRTLVFKWAETTYPVSEILSLTNKKPGRMALMHGSTQLDVTAA